jgi:hypothetical protein
MPRKSDFTTEHTVHRERERGSIRRLTQIDGVDLSGGVGERFHQLLHFQDRQRGFMDSIVTGTIVRQRLMRHWKNVGLKWQHHLPIDYRFINDMTALFLALASVTIFILWVIRTSKIKDYLGFLLGCIAIFVTGITGYQIRNYKAMAERSMWSHRVGATLYSIENGLNNESEIGRIKNLIASYLNKDTKIDFERLSLLYRQLSERPSEK